MTCIDKNHSTTRLLTREKPVLENKPGDKFESVLFLPKGEERKGEGGLRTQGYFKSSLKDKPLITVITVVFNGEQCLEETILSVINQTYDNVEYIIIDGRSTDNTLDIIKKYEHAIDYWVSEKDRGIYDAMNKGIDLSRGDYLIFIGSDDVINSDILNKIFSVYVKNIHDLFFGNIVFKNETVFLSRLNFFTNFYNTVHHQAALYNRRNFINYRYSYKYNIASDYELNLIIYLNGNKVIKKIDEVFSVCGNDGVSNYDFKCCVHEMDQISNEYANYFIRPLSFLFKWLRRLR